MCALVFFFVSFRSAFLFSFRSDGGADLLSIRYASLIYCSYYLGCGASFRTL